MKSLIINPLKIVAALSATGLIMGGFIAIGVGDLLMRQSEDGLTPIFDLCERVLDRLNTPHA